MYSPRGAVVLSLGRLIVTYVDNFNDYIPVKLCSFGTVIWLCSRTTIRLCIVLQAPSWGSGGFLTMYFVNMLPVLYTPALFYLGVVVSYRGCCISVYSSILVLSGVCTVLISECPVLWVGSSGVLLSRITSLCGVLPQI